MPSIIEGYNYDIFISYRQKDNKNDGWVTEFVDLLKKELEATFKEEISVYFDANPRDGLLETHIVEESLSEKLKCLIFIPVLSQTYCDPQSFAWVHEFCAFNELAKGDRFGRDIKLPGGNAASRILPVKIRDLDPEDRILLENEIGGALRCIEFVYMSAGVNRPLRAGEDHPQDNLNRIYYRDQINKVANAIKEILSALKAGALKKDGHQEDELIQREPYLRPVKQNSNRNRIITGSLIILLLIITGVFFLPKLFKPGDQPDRSIAVLPFEVWNSGDGTGYLGSAMANEICTQLSLIKEFRVKSYTSSSRYTGPDKPTIQNIAKELGVNYIIEGSIERQNDEVSIHVQVILAQKDDHIWAKENKGKWADIFKIRADISKMLAEELKISLSPQEKKLIEKIPTANLTAYDLFQRGSEQYIKYLNNPNEFEALEKAKDYFRRALELDPEYAQVYARLAAIFYIENRLSNEVFGKNYLDSARYLAEKALEYDNETSEALVVMGDYYRGNGNLEQSLKEYNAALKINPNSWEAYRGKAYAYKDNDNLAFIENALKASYLTRGTERLVIEKDLITIYTYCGIFDLARSLIDEYLEFTGDTFSYLAGMGIIERQNLDYEGANKYFEEAYRIDTSRSKITGDFSILPILADNCMSMGLYKESLNYYQKFLTVLETHKEINYNDMHRIGYAFHINGYEKEADYYFDLQLAYCNKMINEKRPYAQEYYANYDRAGIYAFRGKREKAIEDLRMLNQRKYQYLWMVNLIKKDPLFDGLRNESEFQEIVKNVEAKYQAEHERVSKWLEENNLLKN